MPTYTSFPSAFQPVPPAALIVAMSLTAVSFRRGLEDGGLTAWSTAWEAAPVVPLVLSLLVFTALVYLIRVATVPHSGVKIPGAGQ